MIERIENILIISALVCLFCFFVAGFPVAFGTTQLITDICCTLAGSFLVEALALAGLANLIDAIRPDGTRHNLPLVIRTREDALAATAAFTLKSKAVRS